MCGVIGKNGVPKTPSKSTHANNRDREPYFFYTVPLLWKANRMKLVTISTTGRGWAQGLRLGQGPQYTMGLLWRKTPSRDEQGPEPSGHYVWVPGALRHTTQPWKPLRNSGRDLPMERPQGAKAIEALTPKQRLNYSNWDWTNSLNKSVKISDQAQETPHANDFKIGVLMNMFCDELMSRFQWQKWGLFLQTARYLQELQK